MTLTKMIMLLIVGVTLIGVCVSGVVMLVNTGFQTTADHTFVIVVLALIVGLINGSRKNAKDEE